MSYFYVEPEVSGSLGQNTIMNTNVHPPIVEKLNYEFDSWLGDDLIESFPCYLVTDNLAKQFISNDFSGFSLDNVVISVSEDFSEQHEVKELPKFFWLKINGVEMKDDFGISDDFRLVVSQNVLKILNLNCIENADIEIAI